MRVNSLYIGAFAFTAAILLSAGVDGYYQAFEAEHSAYDVPLVSRILGESRSIVSSLSLLQADRYFHKGIGHHSHEGLAIAKSEKEQKAAANKKITAPEINRFNVLFWISNAVKISKHVHLQGDQIKEIIPWLYYSAEIDPKNIQAYTLTGYYLADRLGEVTEGIKFLREGLKKNPDSWEISAELGRIYFQRLKNYQAAIYYLSKARDLIQEEKHDKFQERYVLTFLAKSYEEVGQEERARALYDRIDEMFPARDDSR